jgi:hypothetical protein
MSFCHEEEASVILVLRERTVSFVREAFADATARESAEFMRLCTLHGIPGPGALLLQRECSARNLTMR